MKRITQFLVLMYIVFFGISASSQVANYKFEHEIGTFTPNSNNAKIIPTWFFGGTSGSPDFNQLSPEIPFDFSFTYASGIYNKLKVSAFGYVVFDVSSTRAASSYGTWDAPPAQQPSPGYPDRPMLAAFYPRSGGLLPTSKVSYEITGNAPNRVFTIEWLDLYATYLPTAMPVKGHLSLQIKLYETTNIIEYVYKRESNTAGFSDVKIGLSDPKGIGKNTFVCLKTDLTKPNLASDLEVRNITTKPLENQVFRFIPPSCLYTGAVTVDKITTNSASIKLSKPSSVNIEVFYSTGELPTDTTIKLGTIEAGKVELPLQNLNPGSIYNVYFKYTCTTEETIGWKEYAQFQTICAPISGTFFEGFENYPTAQTAGYSNAPVCWTNINDTKNGVANYSHGIGTTRRSGVNGFSSSRNGLSETQKGDLMLISPEISDLGSGNKVLSFWAYGGYIAAPGVMQLKIYTMSGNTANSSKTLIKTINLTSAMAEYKVYFPLGITDKYFAFVNDVSGQTNSFYIDDINYTSAPACKPLSASDLTIKDITKNSGVLTISDIYNATGATYDIEVRETGTPGTPGAVFSRTKQTNKVQNITGLNPSKTYTIYVKVNCAGNTISEWSNGLVFSTMCDYPNWTTQPKAVSYCGPHKATLNAKAASGSVVWFDSKEAPAPLFEGDDFTTPDFVTESRSFFAKTRTTTNTDIKIGTGTTGATGPLYTSFSTFTKLYGSKTQFIITAESLKNQGLAAGNISELKLEVTAGGEFLENFIISLGQTFDAYYEQTTFNGTVNYQLIANSALEEVYTNAKESFSAVGFKNFKFNKPFEWDGESNLVVQFFWYNPNALTKSISIKYTTWVKPPGALGNLYGGLQAYTNLATINKDFLLNSKGGYYLDGVNYSSGYFGNNNNIPVITFVGNKICESPFVEVPVTITTSPEIKLDKTGVSSCDGTASSVIKLVDAGGYTNFTWEPNDVSGTAESGWSFTNTEEKEYTLIASKGDCQAIQKVVNYSNSKPESTGGLAKITDLCKDGIGELKLMAAAQEPVTLSENSKISDKEGQSAYAYGSKYSRQQYIYKSTDLEELGVKAGYINKIAFNTGFSLGVGVNKSYVLKMKMINESSFPSDKFYEGGFATVYRSSKAMPLPGGSWQDIVLDNAFYWDGQSHILLELIQENGTTGMDVPTSITDYTDATVAVQKPENEVGLYRTSDTTSKLVYGTVTTSRLDVRFGFAQPKVNWSPVTNLYLDSKATQPYVAGTDVSTVYVLPNTAGTSVDYNATITSPNNCVATEIYTVKPIDIGLPKIAAQSFCTAVAVTDLVVDAYPGGELTYYSSATSTNKLNEITKTGTYYVELTAAGCKTSRVSFSVNIVDLKYPTVEYTQRICGSGTIADLKAQGVVNSQIKWYATPDSATPLPTTHTLVDNTTYYVSQSLNNCESEKVAVLVDINDAPRSLENQTAYICGVTEFGSINLKQDAGSQLVWYGSQTATQPIANTDKVTSGTYYVSQRVNACESPRAIVEVSVQANVPAPTASIQYKCGGGTVNDLEAEVLSGATVEWYANATATTPLKGETGLTSGTYYVAQRLGSCVSVRKAVSVRIISNNAPIVDPYSLCEGAKVKDLKITAATGVTYKWYRNNASTTALSPEDVLTSAPYFVSRIENGCESLRAQVQVTINNRPKSPTGVSPQTFADYAELSNIVMDQPNVSWYLTYDDAMNGNNKLPVNRPLENGRTYYGVILGVDGCPSMPIAIETFIVLGINDMDLTKLKYYPNPVHDVLTVSYDTPIVKVDVYDLSGKLVMQRSFDNKTISIDLSSLSSGSYMLNIKTAENSQFIKVVKK